MSDGIYIAASGAVARQAHLDTVSHNLANVETPGYRARNVRFEELLVDRASGRSQVAANTGEVDMTEGIIEATENPFDLAIAGDGYFTVGTNEGVAVTRAGNFRTDDNGQLVTPEGYPVLNTSGAPVLVPPNSDFYVDETGNVWDDVGMIDQINIVQVGPNSKLTPLGPSTFKVDGGADSLQASGAMVQQGYLERANVNAVESMTELVTLQRHFEAMQKLIQTYSTIDNRAAKGIGSVSG